MKMLTFQYKEDINSVENLNMFEKLKEQWDELHNIKPTVFRYKLETLTEKVIGDYILQLNHDRGVKRRHPEKMTDICQPFNVNKFNFTKISEDEIMFKFWDEDTAMDIHTVIVNVSPINTYHSMLCPSMYQMLPQIITLESLKLALNIYSLIQDRDLRIAFNSLCAFASVNHLHYHLVFEKKTLPIEVVKCKNIKGPLWLNEAYPIPGFCFDGNLENAAENIFKLIEYFLKNSIAHNLFITRGRSLNGGNEITRVFVWARKSNSGAKTLIAFNVAALELGGLFPIHSEEDFDRLEVNDLERELAKWRLDNFDDLCKDVEELF